MSLHSLMFGWEYPPLHLGGLGVACQGLVQGLRHHNVQITLALPHPHTGSSDDIDIVHPTKEHAKYAAKTIRIDSLLGPYDTQESYAQRLVQHMSEAETDRSDVYGTDLYEAIEQYTQMSVAMTKDVQPDVIHCHDWMTYGAAEHAASHHNKPMIAHIHATELDRTHFSPNEYIYQKELRGFQSADAIIAVSQYTKNVITEHYGIAPSKIHVVHNGSIDMYDPNVHALRSQHKQHVPMILFLGRLTLQKGVHQFLEMAAQVHAIRPEVQFVIAGSGNMFGELIDRACALGIENNVIFTGKVNDVEARKLYLQADCFVMPSLSEPFGLVALEAIAHGTPVILSRQSGVREVVGHSFCIDFWDTQKMADCALTIIREEPLAQQLSTEAPRILHNLTWKNQAHHVKSIYESILSL